MKRDVDFIYEKGMSFYQTFAPVSVAAGSIRLDEPKPAPDEEEVGCGRIEMRQDID